MKILVLCTGNSCRSQMAEGFLRHFAENKAKIYSAGIETHGVNPQAVAVMKEAGIDISGQRSTNIDAYRDINFDYIITVCDHANEHCPFFPGKAERFHQNFSDPAKTLGTETEIKKVFRRVREQIKVYCDKFVRTHIHE